MSNHKPQKSAGRSQPAKPRDLAPIKQVRGGQVVMTTGPTLKLDPKVEGESKDAKHTDW